MKRMYGLIRWKHDSFEFKREILRKIISNEFYENSIASTNVFRIFFFFFLVMDILE